MPARLDRQPEVSPLMNKQLAWVNSHALFFLILFLFILFVLVCMLVMVVTASPTATEANLWYNQLEAII